MTPPHPQKQYRCRYCGALLLSHLSQQHPAEVGAYTARMHTTDDITPVAAEAYEVVEVEEHA